MPLNIDWQQILLHLLNFVILAFGLWLLLYKPVKKFMKKREDSYTEREEQTKAALEDAERKKQEYDEKLSAAEEEIATTRQEALAEVAELREQRIQAAKAEAEGIVADAVTKAEDEKRKIKESADADIRDIVSDLTNKVVMDSLVDEAYETFLSQAEKENEDGQD